MKHKKKKRDKVRGSSAFHNEFMAVYVALYSKYYSELPRFENIYKDRKIINNLLRRYTEKQMLAMLFLHFEWYGRHGTNGSDLDVLIVNHFPVNWISARANMYEAYIRSTLGEAVWNNGVVLAHYVDTWERKLFAKKAPLMCA